MSNRNAVFRKLTKRHHQRSTFFTPLALNELPELIVTNKQNGNETNEETLTFEKLTYQHQEPKKKRRRIVSPSVFTINMLKQLILLSSSSPIHKDQEGMEKNIFLQNEKKQLQPYLKTLQLTTNKQSKCLKWFEWLRTSFPSPGCIWLQRNTNTNTNTNPTAATDDVVYMNYALDANTHQIKIVCLEINHWYCHNNNTNLSLWQYIDTPDGKHSQFLTTSDAGGVYVAVTLRLPLTDFVHCISNKRL